MQRQPVLRSAPHPGVNLVSMIAGVVVCRAAHRFRQMYAVRRRHPFRVHLPQRLVGSPTRRVQLVHQVDDVILHPLEPPDGRPELHPRPAVLHRHLINPLRSPHLVGAQQRNRPRHRLLQRRPAAGKGAVIRHRAPRQHGRTLNLNPVQSHLRQIPRKPFQPANRHPRRIGRRQCQPHLLPVLVPHRAYQVGDRRRVIHIHLDAGNAVAVPVRRRHAMHIGFVPLVIGFRNRQRHRASPGGKLRQQRPFLRLRAGFQDGQRSQRAAAQMRPRRRPAPQLLKKYAGVSERTPFAAVLGGYDDAQPAGGRQLLPGLRRRRLPGGRQLQQRFFRVLGVHKPARRRLQHFLFFGEGQVHRSVSPLAVR